LGWFDFLGFYSSGRVARAGELGRLYDVDAQYAIQRAVNGPDFSPDFTSLSQHPPILAPLLAAIAGDDYVTAYIRWTVVLILVLIGCATVVAKWLIAAGWERRTAIISSINGICFYPVFLSVVQGQDTAFILLGLLIWMLALLQHRELLAGSGLAMATLSPQIAGTLALPLIASRRPAAWWFCVVVSLLTLYCLALIGGQGARDFLNLLLSSAQGQGNGVLINQADMFNFLGLLLRSAPDLDPEMARMLAWGGVLFSTSLMCRLWWGKGIRLTANHIGLAVVLGVFTSPHLHSHSLSLLLLPLLTLMSNLWNRGGFGQIAALVSLPVCSWLMLFGHFAGGPWFYRAAYALMMVLAGGLFMEIRRHA
jgi:hypothetical protein